MTKSHIEDAQIRETAYLFWLDEGQPEGRDQEHWLRAIDALNAPKPKAKRTRKPAAKSAAKTAKAAPKTRAKVASKAKPKVAAK